MSFRREDVSELLSGKEREKEGERERDTDVDCHIFCGNRTVTCNILERNVDVHDTTFLLVLLSVTGLTPP
jgi:hypothetical protein